MGGGGVALRHFSSKKGRRLERFILCVLLELILPSLPPQLLIGFGLDESHSRFRSEQRDLSSLSSGYAAMPMMTAKRAARLFV